MTSARREQQLRRPRPRFWLAPLIIGVTTRSIPELRHCRSDFEVTEAASRAKLTRPTLREIAPVIIYVSFVLLVVFGFTASRPYWLPEWMILVIIMAVTLAFIMLMSSWTSESYRRRVRAYLLTRGIPLCQSCGYDLRGAAESPTTETPCPECGKPYGEVASVLASSGPRAAAAHAHTHDSIPAPR